MPIFSCVSSGSMCFIAELSNTELYELKKAENLLICPAPGFIKPFKQTKDLCQFLRCVALKQLLFDDTYCLRSILVTAESLFSNLCKHTATIMGIRYSAYQAIRFQTIYKVSHIRSDESHTLCKHAEWKRFACLY